MNKDNLRTLVRNIDSDLFDLISHVICSICQELLTKPVTTPCGHSFCSACIKRVISSKDNSGCPLCKNPVKRYCLETDQVKSTLTEIFRKLPAAFEKDVQDLSAHFNDTAEDLIKNSKLAQLSGQDYEKDVKSNKRKTSVLKKSQKPSTKSRNTEASDNDVDSFVPVLKRSKNVIEYASAKKKKMDDLISISQREVESDSGVCDTSGLDKKLEQIEKVSTEEKINEWFKAVGSNIYLSSPGTNYLDSPSTKTMVESQGLSRDDKEGGSANNSSSMIRRDYKKVANPSHCKEKEKESDTKAVIDPYEFIPSQNNRNGRRRGRKCSGKKTPDFKSLHSFTKESVKRNIIILADDKEDGGRENETGVSVRSDKSACEFPAVTMSPDVITASQKFDKLLSESKEKEKKENVKGHVLYSASQASSTQFLDCSYQSRVAEVRKAPKKRRSGVSFRKIRKSISTREQESIPDLFPKGTRLSTKCPNTRTGNVDEGEGGSARSTERKESSAGDEAKADERQSFSEIMDLKSEEALDLEKSVEEYLMRFKKDNKSLKGTSREETHQQTKTKLVELLGELVNDDVVYKNHPRNVPVELKNQRKDSEVGSREKISQQRKTKLMELLEELINDETVYGNHPRNAPVKVKNRRKGKDRETDSKVSLSEKTFQPTKTKLMEVLEELVNDDVVYKNHPRDAPVDVKNGRRAEGDSKKPNWNKSSSDPTSNQHQSPGYNSKSSGREETTKPLDDLKSGKFTQGTHLLGFSTQDELIDEKMFKEMVMNMERELELSESDLNRTPPLGQCNEKRDENSALNSSYDRESPSADSKLSRNELANSSFITFNCLGKIRRSKSCFINFLRLGRLTPTVKRSRSSVVKLVFPIGLSSFARKRVIQDKLLTGGSISESPLSTNENGFKNETCVPSSRSDHVSTGIQTPRRLVSSAEIQTSLISKSVIVQTSQVLRPSVEVQTVRENCCAGIQTSQMPSPQRSYKSAEIQTSQPPCESCRANLPLLRDSTNDLETEYIPGSVGYDEPEFLPKKNNSRDFEDTECSFRKLRSSKDRTCSLEKGIEETLSPPRLSNKNKRKSLSPAKKHFYKHRKISSRKKVGKEKSWSPESKSPGKTEEGTFQDKPCSSSLIVDSEMKREFDETWVRKSQKSCEDLVETKNKRNRGEEAVDRECEISSPTEKVQEQQSLSHVTQNLSGLIDEVLQKFETRQRIPLDVRKVSSDDDYEMIDLGTPESVRQSSQDQVVQVLKNIDLDLKGKESRKGNGKGAACTGDNLGNGTKGEKSEESDSDFFVEQTPPRPSNSRVGDQESVNSFKFDSRRSSCIEKVDKEEDDEKKVLNSQGTDLIGDSLPKDLTETESFLMVSAPQKVVLTPENRESHNVSYIEKRGRLGSQSFPKEKSFSTVKKLETCPRPNENDQNQLNAGSETKSSQHKTWIKADESPHVKVSLQSRQKLCVVASSVKNLDMIKKFVIKFKMEYSNKPTKNMTHLIVGMHESDEGEVLPLCTPKLLFAMANKKWIVSESWAETCLKMDSIVPEEGFEASDPVGGQGCRNARLSTQPLLRDCEIYLLGNFQAISKEDFAGLILDCGGIVIQKPEQFSFSPLKLRMIVADQDCLNMDKNQLQELHEKYSTVILSRDVILMSIQSYKLANFSPHFLHPTSEEELVKMGYPSQLVKSEEEDSGSNWNSSK